LTEDFRRRGSQMSEEPEERVGEPTDEYVKFLGAGESGKGQFQCSECGYGVTVYRTLPVCPMCSGGSWERATWSPFRRATRLR
jgi:rubrerythrin